MRIITPKPLRSISRKNSSPVSPSRQAGRAQLRTRGADLRLIEPAEVRIIERVFCARSCWRGSGTSQPVLRPEWRLASLSVEGFESFCKVAMETEGLVVSGGVKFPVARPTKKAPYPSGIQETQTHGYEVDLVGADANRLVLASVKSYFGSRGVLAAEVTGAAGDTGRYRLLNDQTIRQKVIVGACARYGYELAQVSLRLYVGKWASSKGIDNRAVTLEWCATQIAGGGPISVIDVETVVEAVKGAAASSTYVDDPVIVALKVLTAAGALNSAAVNPTA